MTNRRKFIKQITIAGIATTGLPSALLAMKSPDQKLIWGNLLHLSYNMWEDNIPLKYKDDDYECSDCAEARLWAHPYRSTLTFDDSVWDELLDDMARVGMNMVIIDVGDGIEYDCHPEISVKNAWSHDKLRSQLTKMRKMGLEPIPKLNFATTHDTWLGEYSRMVSTKKYYEVCRNVISEVIELFDKPRFLHLGMDEELASHQSRNDHITLRQNDLWWGDLYFYIGELEKKGVRAWLFSDYARNNLDIFLKKMPLSVVQSNWYYGQSFDPEKITERNKISIGLYEKLEAKGYDQIPTTSNHSNDLNMEATVEYCKNNIDPSRLMGFVTAPWRPTLTPCLQHHKNAIEQMGKAMKKFY